MPNNETASASYGAAVKLAQTQPKSDLAWLKTFAALAEPALLNDDLGSETTQPQPPSWRDGHFLNAVAACVSDYTLEHPRDEGLRIGGAECGHR